MNKALEKVNIMPERAAQAASALTPMDMLNRAVSSGANIEVLEKLMVLQERYEANQSRKAFDEAVANAKAEMPVIVKNATGHNSKKYADFAAIAAVVDPIITRHGLSYRFRTTQNERINVTCILSHKLGHFEETTLAGPPDASGSKNAIQAIGSTLTYLQRYSLVQALGLAASNDDDGKTVGAGEAITEKQADELNDLIESVGANRSKFLQYFKIASVDDLPVAKYQDAVVMLSARVRT